MEPAGPYAAAAAPSPPEVQPQDEAAPVIAIRTLPLPMPPPQPPATIKPQRPPVPTRRPLPPSPPSPPQQPTSIGSTTSTNPFDDSTTQQPPHHHDHHHHIPTTTTTRSRRARPPAAAAAAAGPVIFGWTQAPRNPFDETLTLESPIAGGASSKEERPGATATISAALLRKQMSVMPVEIVESSSSSSPLLNTHTHALGEGGGGGGCSPRPFGVGDEEAGLAAAVAAQGSGTSKRLSFRYPEEGGATASVVDGDGDGEDGRVESVDPALARSYDARQIGFHLARTYQRLYSPEQRRALKWEYRDILKRHGQNTAVRRMHRQIVLDVLASSDTPLPTILLNGLCPLGLRPALRCLCCINLTDNYWQKNLDDEITFYALQFLAFSILPIFPTLLDACVALLSPLRWEVRQPSCREARPYSATGQWLPDYSSATAAATAAVPSTGAFAYNSTSSCVALERRDAVGAGTGVEAGNTMDATGRGIYYTDPLLWDPLSGTCQLSEAILGRTTAEQWGVMFIYLSFILWALYELYVKLRELEYVKIANHLRAVYVPNMVAPPRQHHGHTEPDDDNDDDGNSSNDKPKPRRRWWQLWGPRSQPSTTPTNKGQQPSSPPPSAAGGAGGPQQQQQQQQPRQRRRARRPSMDEVSKSVAAGASSYRTRQFPEVFLLLLTALLALCLVALWRSANQDTECLVVPGFVVDAGIREWMARAYEAWAQRAASRAAGRAGTRMCYGVWRCAPASNAGDTTLYPFVIHYKQTRVSTVLQVVVETGIFAATAYKLLSLLKRSYFFIDVERYMDPAYEPPYKGIHEHRSRIMTRAMVEDYICLRREMFVEAVKKNLPYLFDSRQLHSRPFSPKYQQGLTPDIS